MDSNSSLVLGHNTRCVPCDTLYLMAPIFAYGCGRSLQQLYSSIPIVANQRISLVVLYSGITNLALNLLSILILQAVTEPNAAARAVELLEHLGNLITVPYTPPPVRSRSQLTPRSRGQTAAAGASGSNGRPSSRESGNKLPLLVRMASRAAPRQAGGASTGSASPRQSLLSPRAAAAAAAGYGADSRTASGSHVGTFLSFIEEEEQQTSNLTNTSSKQQQQGLSSSRRVGNNPDLETDHNISTADNEHDNENASDEYLDYRSAHLSDFLLAVRSSAQSRNRGASLLGMGGMSAARAAAELGVPLQATFSSGGTAR